MKKLRKTKKSKNQEQKGKWSVGKTVASVIGAISLISGATVLGVYLTGGFEERIVRPESIVFEYDDNLYRNNQLEISGVDEFSLTINTPTENVTKDKVKLYFGSDVAYKETTKYISNGVIQVPKEVSLGQAFEVKLLDISKSDDDKALENIILNGTTLYAEGDNNMIEPISIKIGVDCPVQRIENHITDLSGNILNAVGAGQEFKIATTFYPAVSRYMYGDTSREKVVLYSITSGNEYIEQTYDDNFGVTFKAGNEIVDGITINAYTFKSAKAQEEAFGYLSDEDNKETRYDNLYTQLTGGEHISNVGINITMASASISSFDIGKDGKTITVKEGERETVKVNGNDDFISLGGRIESTDNQILSYMLENVALEFVHSNGTPFAENEIGSTQGLNIGGRKEMVDGHILFLPYNTPADKNNCYWDITSSLSQDIRVNVYLVVTEAGGKTLFKVGNNVQVKSFTLKTESVQNEEPTFIGQDEVTLNVPQEIITLSVENNAIVEQSLNLKDYITNKNQSVQFYVKATDGNIAEIIKGPFNGETNGWTKLFENTITIIGAGSFEVKFETIKEDGSVIQTCEATKTFICQQALSEGSIDISKTTLTVTQAGENVETGEAYIAPIDSDKFEVTFSIASTSSSAFAEELKNGKISLAVFGKKGGEIDDDITEYFSITSSPENPTESLTYIIKLKSAPNEDREITRIILTYKKDSNSVNDIDWTILLPLTTQNDEGENITGAKIIIYSPKTDKISIENAPTSVNYIQTLETSGLKTSISAGDDKFANVQALISAITGENGSNILLTDQKGRTDTLKGKWKFVIQEGSGILNLEKQTFNVKGTGTVQLKIQADDNAEKFAMMNEEGYVLTLIASAKGIDHLAYQNDKKVAQTGMIDSENISSVKVEKYGMKDATLNLSDLVKFYLSEGTSELYGNVLFKFSSGYFETLTDSEILDLFGGNGMLSIKLKDGQDYENFAEASADDIKASLEGKGVTSIKVNYNFGKICDLTFEISDTNNTFSTIFTLSLLSNFDMNEATYNNLYCETEIDLVNQITYNEKSANAEWVSTLAEIYGEGTWYVLRGENGYYYVSEEEIDASVATITNGKITFKDFFDEESKDFQISFNDKNAYKLNFSNKFTVARNIKVDLADKSFYIYNTSDDNAMNISSYITVKRIQGDSTISSDVIFATTERFLGISDNKTFTTKENITFAYNKQSLVEEVTISCGGYEIGKVNIKIEFAQFSESSLYNEIFKLLSGGDNIQADIQVIGDKIKADIQVINDVTYIVLDSEQSTMWSIEGTLLGQSVTVDNSSKSYTKQGDSGFKLKSQTQTLAGYNDPSYYLAFKVNGLAVNIVVPLIISKVGSYPIVFGDKSNKDLGFALMSAEDLAKNNKTNTLEAGGEYTLEAFSRFTSDQQVKFDELGAEALERAGYKVNRDILKEIGFTKQGELYYPSLSLNNLDKDYGDIFLPLVWTVNDVTFHYLIKVEANIEIKGAIYAYDGVAEYISCVENETHTIDFNTPYDEKTLHENETRFSIKSEDTKTSTINYYIKSVSIGGGTYTSEDQWGSKISFDLSESGKIKITPKTKSPVTIVVGISSIDYGDYSTIFNEKTYTIILNENTVNYVVDIPELTNENNVYTWNISNIGAKTRDLTIRLCDSTGAIITEKEGSSEGLGITPTIKEKEELGKAIEDCKYNNTMTESENGIPATTLRLTLNKYISDDKEITFILYTKYGYLATLKVNLTANASVALKANASSQLNGGASYAFADLFDVKLDNNKATYLVESIEGQSYSIDEITFEGNGKEFVKYDKGTITVVNLFEDLNVTMKATISFDENKTKTFTFTQEFTLKANVALKTTGLPDGKVVANNDLTVKAVDFIDKNIENAIIICEKDERWEIAGNESQSITITPKYVSTQITYTMKLTIKLSSCIDGNYSVKIFDYTITVYPAVTLTPNYPIPSGEDQLDREYIQNGQVFTNILQFLNEHAEYSEQSRVVLKGNSLINGNLLPILSKEFTKNDDLSILITAQNAHLEVGGKEKNNGDKISVDELGETIVFKKGTSATQSIITFSVTYKGVTTSYTIEILDEVFTFVTNYQTNNIEAGDYNNSTAVTYETLYMDKTNISDLFAKDRMAKINLKTTVTEGDYKFVFKDENGYYVSQNVAIFSKDAGKLMTYDLGYSMTEKSLYGVYLASALADGTKFTINGESLSAKEAKIEDLLKDLTNYQDSIFDNITYTNRVELRYGGEIVDYEKYVGVNKDKLELGNADIDEIKYCDVFKKNDKYSYEYYYKATIDITVDQQATGVQNYQIVNVNEETESIVEFFGIRHVTTGNLVSKSEFSSAVNLSYEICNPDDTIKDLNDRTASAYAGINFVDNTKQYFKIEVGKRNSQNGVYDFEFLPLGAGNTGNFILTKLTYTANGISKDFYIVLKIMPDYYVTFNNVENGVEEEKGNDIILSNSQSIISVENIKDDEYYEDFTLLKTSSTDSGILSIKHKNGLNPDTELASNFKVTLPLNQDDYNNSINVNNKLKLEDSSNWSSIKSTDNNNTTTTTGYELTGSSKFTQVPKVVFGEQKYYIEVEDDFGFKIRLYFSLKLVGGSSPKQYSSSAVSVVEGKGVDITARYEQLAITEGEANNEGVTPLIIHSTYIDPESADTPLIELSGIEAYGFAKSYDEYLTASDNGGYKVNTGERTTKETQTYSIKKILGKDVKKGEVYTLTVTDGEATFNYLGNNITLTDKTATITIGENNTDELKVTVAEGKSVTFTITGEKKYSLDTIYSKYLSVPAIQYVTVNKVIFKNESGKELETVDTFNGKTTLATTSSDKLTFNGYSPRSVNPMFTMPTLDSSIFGTNSTARVTMYIELQYTNGENTEVCTVPVNIEVTRGLTLQEGDTNVAEDDIPFEVADIFKVQTSKDEKTTSLSYINDTLEVKVNAGSNVKFKLIKGDVTKEHSISNVGYNYAKTYYLSISEILGENVKKGDQITIEVDKENSGKATFAYLVDNDNKTDTKNSLIDEATNFKDNFTISAITQDKISVDNSTMLSPNSYYKQAKYYLVAKDDGTDKYYRFVKNYYVTGKYYKMRNTSTHEIDNLLNINTTTSPTVWGANLLFYNLIADGDIVNLGTASPADVNNLIFEIDKTESSTDDDIATIDENSGVITIKEGFTKDNYVKVNIYQKISGDVFNDSPYKLGSIRLGLSDTTDNTTGETIGKYYSAPETGFKFDEYASTAESKTATIVGFDKKLFVGDKVIPSTVTYNGVSYKVTSIADNAFADCTGLTGITIPECITSIGDYAFEGCTGLTSITIPASVTSIGTNAFEGCTNLEKIEVDSGNTKYHSNGNCIIETASKTLIAGCKTSVIPTNGSVTSIGESAFYGCTSLTSITIPRIVTNIGENAFVGCTGLESVVFENKNAWVVNCRQVTRNEKAKAVNVSDEKQNATYLRETYAEVEWDNGILNFGIKDSTKNTAELLQIDIPKQSRTMLPFYCSIPSTIFLGEKEYDVVQIGDGTSSSSIIRNPSDCYIYIRIQSAETITEYAFNHSNVSYVYLPDNLETIGNYAFSGCSSLQYIEIPSATSIGNAAFENCSNLQSITIPSSVTSIGSYAFYGCSNLQSFEIPSNLTTIASYTFAGCSSLRFIAIPSSVTTIQANAFGSCSNLTSVLFDDPSGWKAGTHTCWTSTLQNTSTAAKYLTSTYVDKKWTKS